VIYAKDRRQPLQAFVKAEVKSPPAKKTSIQNVRHLQIFQAISRFFADSGKVIRAHSFILTSIQRVEQTTM
jgi:hypothetical protein